MASAVEMENLGRVTFIGIIKVSPPPTSCTSYRCVWPSSKCFFLPELDSVEDQKKILKGSTIVRRNLFSYVTGGGV